MSNAVLWRVFLVQIVIICGVVGIAWLGLPRITLITFVALKLYTDATSQLPQYDPAEAPAWMVCVFGNGFARYWRATKRIEQAPAAAEGNLLRPTDPFGEDAESTDRHFGLMACKCSAVFALFSLG